MNRRSDKAPVVLITGGSSGIGKATAAALLARGCTVYTISRREAALPGVHHLIADVTDEVAVETVVKAVADEAGRIDILINNAGCGISGAVEFTDTEQAQRLFDVNFFGMVRVIRAALPVMREHGGGRIFNISSVAAPLAIPFQAYYSASKSAVLTYSAALDNEVKPFGIRVCAVLPGDIATGFTAAREKSVRGDDVYGGRIERSVGRMEKDEQSGLSTDYAGAFLAKIALRNKMKPQVVMGGLYRLAVIAGRLLPISLVNWILGKMYAS
ncbi:MAG: SDR family NAD(P)-dependent oxidoreductase [Clostridia bacterium]|nr:SDR family NAD(P)-dependent oxidoreductase [Clostridia bacterium]